MNLVGYLITLTNLQNYHDTHENINNVSIRVAEVGKLADEILSNPLIWDKFSQNGYYRDGNIGKYITRNILEYIYYGEGNPKESGLMLTLHFGENSPLIDSGPLGIFAHEKDLHPDIVEAVEHYFKAGKVGRSR